MSILHTLRDHLAATAEAGEAELGALAAKVTGHRAQLAAVEAELAKPDAVKAAVDEAKAALDKIPTA